MAKASADDVDWEIVRRDYEADEMTIPQLADFHGVTQAQIRYRREKEGWTPRTLHGLARGEMIERLFSVLGRQILQLEVLMKRKTKDGQSIADKDVGLLNTMTRTLEKLIELDAREKGTTQTKKRPETEDLRAQLVQRITELARR